MKKYPSPERKRQLARRDVMNGKAEMTRGGLTKADMRVRKDGHIVSKAASARAKRLNRLVKAGFKTKKGTFKLFPKTRGRKSKSKTTKKKATKKKAKKSAPRRRSKRLAGSRR